MKDALPKPPYWSEKILSFWLDVEDREIVLGDFAEIYYHLVQREGVRRAQCWYWLEIFRATPALLQLKKYRANRRYMMKNATFLQNHNRLALVGLVCCLPALLLVSGGLLQSVLGLPQVNDTLNFDLFLFHPAVILGGLIIGFMLNALSVLRIDLQFREDMLISTLRLKINWLSLGLIGLTLSLVSIIFVYLLAENFQIFQTVG